MFGSESVVVSDAGGKIVSESVSERRLHLGKGAANRLGAATADFNVAAGAVGQGGDRRRAEVAAGRAPAPVAAPTRRADDLSDR